MCFSERKCVTGKEFNSLQRKRQPVDTKRNMSARFSKIHTQELGFLTAGVSHLLTHTNFRAALCRKSRNMGLPGALEVLVHFELWLVRLACFVGEVDTSMSLSFSTVKFYLFAAPERRSTEKGVIFCLALFLMRSHVSSLCSKYNDTGVPSGTESTQSMLAITSVNMALQGVVYAYICINACHIYR